MQEACYFNETDAVFPLSFYLLTCALFWYFLRPPHSRGLLCPYNPSALGGEEAESVSRSAVSTMKHCQSVDNVQWTGG
jgi:hypothetical protein